MQEYANNAYKNAGMSANAYMENATAFSASLISSLGGDTQKAAEYANRAMISMSDNANKMGTSLDTIVRTYQSLSRGNMAMLDNLKLGYGGTKAELQRLIKDAASYTEVQKEMGITVDATSMSFANIVNAIAVVQGHLGIAGATAMEASTTVEGSINSMKAAWENLVTGIGTSNANIDVLLNNFLLSVQTVAANVGPVIATVIDNILTLLINNGPAMIAQGGEQLNKFLVGLTSKMPDVIKFIGDMVIAMGKALLNSLPYMLAVAISFMANILTTMTEAAVNIGKNIVSGVWNGIQAMAGWFRDSVMGFFSNIVNGVKSALGIHSPSRVFAEIGKNMALGLGGGWEKEISDIRKDVMNDMDFGEATINGSVQVATGGGYYSQNSTETNTNVIHAILEYLATLEENMGENLRNALDGIALELNEREFIRLVKAVN